MSRKDDSTETVPWSPVVSVSLLIVPGQKQTSVVAVYANSEQSFFCFVFFILFHRLSPRPRVVKGLEQLVLKRRVFCVQLIKYRFKQ